ncbi:LCP family protein [Lachnoanaerobaculum gingivalis]|mgnify:FL=1|uniref:LCP family protein n=1 Tax=Lachnoanaerobaculum gingivalis TaxID=2490855 RepID=UPI0024A6669F|nr:LCP family protein [Lachnoanaerobaculum gingivalis]WHE87453.1 LCP family protein [Lachnoanaerobaculum gingivalis]
MSEEKKKSRKKKKSKIAFFITMLIAEMLVLGVIFAYAYVLKQYSKIQRPDYDVEEVANTGLSEKKLQEMRGYRNIALFGVDSRDNSVGKGNRSDVIIICSIDQATGDIKLVSVYRDTYLDVGKNSFQKATHAYSYGGPARAVKMLNDSLDLNITDYVTFNWKAVATAINILGGVDIEVTKPEFKYINSYITETVKGTGIGSVQLKAPGMQHLDGVQAVAYARLRYMDTDYQRTERQRKVIELAFEKAKKADLKTLNDLLGNMLSMVATNLTWQDGLDVINDFGKYNLKDTAGFPFKFDDMTLGTKGFIVVPINLESNVLELHKYLFGDENYEVSAKVKAYSDRISSDTGVYKDGDSVKRVKTSGGYKSNKNNDDEDDKETKSKKKSTTEDETKKSVDIYIDNNGRYYQLDKDGETVWIDKDEENNYYTDGDGNKYYIKPTEKGSAAERDKTTGNSKIGVNVGPGETTQASKGSNVEIINSSTEAQNKKNTTAETQTKKVNGPGEATVSSGEAQPRKSNGPGETNQAQTKSGKSPKESTVEPLTTTAKEETVAPAPNVVGPGSTVSQTVEAKPE